MRKHDMFQQVRAWFLRWRVRLGLGLAVTVGIVLGAIANRFPNWVTTRHSYCTMCALHHEESESTPLLGRHRSNGTYGKVLNKLLSPVIGEHTHHWTEPDAYVHPTYPVKKLGPREEFMQAVVEDEIRDLELLEDSPHMIALLDEAMRNDRDRTIKFLTRILDPRAFVGVEAIALLDRPTSWENRWAVVDAFLETHHCDTTDVSVSCRMRSGSTDLLVLVRTAGSVHKGGVDWAHWVPPGMKAPPGAGVPTAFAAVSQID